MSIQSLEITIDLCHIDVLDILVNQFQISDAGNSIRKTFNATETIAVKKELTYIVKSCSHDTLH